MAILSAPQAIAAIKTPANQAAIQKAISHELRIRLHTEPITDCADFTDAHNRFLLWADEILGVADKKERFRQLFTVPIPTNEITEEIFKEFPRALQAYNKYIKNTFSNEALELDFKKFLDKQGFDDFWSGDAMDAIKTRINSFVIYDLPSVQKDSRPEPYMYLLGIQHVRDVEVSGHRVEYIAFWQDISWDEQQAGIIEKYLVIDDSTYRYFTKVKDGDFVMTAEVSHFLGYCPAKKFWAEPVNKNNYLNSRSPITNSLGQLDKYLFWYVSIEYYKLYGMFPIFWGYTQKCDYKNEVTGASCDSKGVITWVVVDGMSRVAHHAKCPACQARKAIGPGTFITVDPPAIKEQADLREPVGSIPIDVDALTFMQDWLKAEEAKIIQKNTGKQTEVTKEAMNEDQVHSQLESRKNVIMDAKENLEQIIAFSYTVLAKLRYREQFIKNTTDLGDQFFLASEEQLNKEYSEAKTAGRPNFELASKRDFIYLTKYHNNPEELQKLTIMLNLEPYQDYSLSDLTTLGIKDADPAGFFIKLNFNNFVKRFERENLPLTRFGSALTFQSKIQIIYDTFALYAQPFITLHEEQKKAEQQAK